MAELDLKQHAEAFEQLVVRLLETQYATAPTFVCVTAASHDGGYDGVLRLNVFTPQQVEHVSLVEAKLRASRQLELAAIGKSVVIAYTAAANALYIATNGSFAPQALKHLALFQWKTNLRIVLLDGGVLSAWVQRERAKLAAFDASLLDYIAEAAPRDRRVLEYIDPDDETPIQAHVSTTAHLPRYELDAGWDGERLAPNELRPATEARVERELPHLVGATRRAAVRRLAGLVEASRGVVLISGGAGAGKSFFIRHVRRELARRGMASTLINMTGVTTRRVFFLRLLAALTGVNVEAAAAEEGVEGLRALLATLSADGVPSERDVVAALLASADSDPFRDKTDARINLLTSYLARVARRVVRPQVLFYENLEHSTREVLDLLRTVTTRLIQDSISTVFEARRFGEVGIGRDTGAQEEQRLSPEEWGVVVDALAAAATLEHYELPELSDPEARELIERHWPGFGRDRADVIIRRVGRTPLFIESALNWLHASETVTGVATARVIADLEQFFEGISPTQISQLFRRHLQLWWGKYERVFAAASLLDGELPLRALAALLPGNSDGIATDLVRTRLFEVDPSAEGVRVVHNLIVDELESLFQTGERSYAGRPTAPELQLALRRTAQVLLPQLRTVVGEERAALKAPLLLGAAGRWLEALDAATAAIAAERARSAWPHVSSLGVFALRASLHLPSEEQQNDRRLALLREVLTAEQHRGRLALEVNAGHVEELENRIATTPALNGTPAGRATIVTSLLLAASHHFTREEFELALRRATDAETLALAHDGIPEEDCATAFHFHGLALKGLDQRAESFRVYADAVARLPAVPFLRHEERSNLAAFNLMTKPALARRYYLQMLAARKDEPAERKLHVLVDVAMAEFLMKRYDDARRSADAARELADAAKSYLEAARARNILGCCAWVDGSVTDADLLFDAAAFGAERTLSKRYLWRIRANRAGTALDGGRADLALATARSAEGMITTPRAHAIAQFAAMPHFLQSRWYVALIALGAIYLQLDADEYARFLARVPIADLAVDCPRAVARRFRREVFAGTTHLHARRIMITG